MVTPEQAISILLINPPYKETIIRDNYCCFTSKSGYLWPPVDLLYLSGILYDKATEVHVIDAVAERLTWDQVENKISIIRPDILITLTGTVSYADDIPPLKEIKEKYGTRIYLIGNTPTFKPEYFFHRFPFIDGIIHNFLDNSVKNFLLQRKHNCKTVSYRSLSGKRITRGVVNQLPPMEEVRIGHPPLYHLFPLSRYSTPLMKKKPMITMLTSFGCQFNCSFCVASALQFHPRAMEDIKKELDAIREHGIKEIFFEDSTFNNVRMESICRLMIEENYGFSWSANVHSYRISREILQIMKRSGCHTVQIGVESGNRDTLNKYAPSKKMEKISAAISLCKKEGLRVLGYFIIGFPNETKSMAENTVKFARKTDPDYASFSILTPDFGTKLYEEAVHEKLIPPEIVSFDSSGDAVLNNSNLTTQEQDETLMNAYRQFYLRPSKVIRFLTDVRNLRRHIQNGLSLIFKKII